MCLWNHTYTHGTCNKTRSENLKRLRSSRWSCEYNFTSSCFDLHHSFTSLVHSKADRLNTSCLWNLPLEKKMFPYVVYQKTPLLDFWESTCQQEPEMDCRSGHGKRQAMETCLWKKTGRNVKWLTFLAFFFHFYMSIFFSLWIDFVNFTKRVPWSWKQSVEGSAIQLN